jgi:hypothetical protein
MITVELIKQKAEKWYREFLYCALTETPFFPKGVPTDDGTKMDFLKRHEAYEVLRKHSKSQVSYGYSIVFKKMRKKGAGEQILLDKIVFENESDYLRFIGKTNDYTVFKKWVKMIEQELPHLATWIRDNPLKITDLADKWSRFISICRYFLETYEPQNPQFIRALPIPEVDTKFIEQNKKILYELLNLVLPPEKIQSAWTGIKNFEKRFYLKEADPMIRMRSLDDKIKFGQFSEVQVNISELDANAIPCQHVFIVENQTTYFKFPRVEDAIILFGKGYAVDILKFVDWLKDRKIYYWGDIDTNGFHILSILRGFLPQTQSFLMDNILLFEAVQYASLRSKELKQRFELPKYLIDSELQMYKYLLECTTPNANRLEQEYIEWSEIENYLHRIMGIF